MALHIVRTPTSSAASVPAIENSRSAYFFQYPKSSGNLAKNRSYISLVATIDCGLELRLSPPSRPSAARTSFSQASKLSGSSSYLPKQSVRKEYPKVIGRNTYHFSIELLQLGILLIGPSKTVIRHNGLPLPLDECVQRSRSIAGSCKTHRFRKEGPLLELELELKMGPR